ncbi:MAG: hypothetical protein AB1668_05275 [Nanoarchaeota archaeon]
MVKKQERQRAIKFICERLENSGLYTIVTNNDFRVKAVEKVRVVEGKIPGQYAVQPAASRTIDTILANGSAELSTAFPEILEARSQRGVYTAPVLYKDGKTAFVRMVERSRSWRSDKSLKRYTPQQINQMLHLRKIEKELLESFGNIFGPGISPSLVYYQPETARLPESLGIIQMHPVWLDYGHIQPGHQAYGFVRNRDSIDYKLPEDSGGIEPAARIEFARSAASRKAVLASAPLFASAPSPLTEPVERDAKKTACEEPARKQTGEQLSLF